MKQTAVEFLIEQIKSKADNLPTNTKENRMAKGIYVDCLIMARQAKEMEKQQGYSLEDLECAWSSSEQNMRFQFSSSAYKGITFKQWLEKFKEEHHEKE
jgi:hypothetical protein